MKKILSAALLALLCGSGNAFAAGNTEAPNVEKFSLGYEGILAGNVVQGLSSRYWFTNNVGGEVNLSYGRLGVNIDNASIDDSHASLLMGSAKVMYAPVVKEHSRFYVGLEGGIGNVGIEVNDEDALPNTDVNVYVVSPLIGSEFYFAELPELGLNWEVGYRFQTVNIDDDAAEVDLKLDGTFVTVGAHYYF
ncbi:MAG: hypothetical protein HGB16_01170 [Chlorobaculum sp.]|nr:hypothetical protein [Chlorobaculum sp.]